MGVLTVVLITVVVTVVGGGLGYFCLRYSGLNEDNKTFWFSIFCFGIALVEFIFMVGVLFVNEVGWNLAELLRVHFYVMIILSFGISFVGLILIIIRVFRWKGEDQKDKKW